ncbi:matrin-3-like [Protopterus annectens]|uniref:matrin-3-like n=1 Tax=Protopterus annectens TaxID=7888 RepID=UPI001CFAE157|nr:matrin-3-like [Protopterus annectens]
MPPKKKTASTAAATEEGKKVPRKVTKGDLKQTLVAFDLSEGLNGVKAETVLPASLLPEASVKRRTFVISSSQPVPCSPLPNIRPVKIVSKHKNLRRETYIIPDGKEVNPEQTKSTDGAENKQLKNDASANEEPQTKKDSKPKKPSLNDVAEDAEMAEKPEGPEMPKPKRGRPKKSENAEKDGAAKSKSKGGNKAVDAKAVAEDEQTPADPKPKRGRAKKLNSEQEAVATEVDDASKENVPTEDVGASETDKENATTEVKKRGRKKKV